MKPELDVEGLKKTKGWEYAVRFAFGGIVTAGAALVTHTWGPSVGGLFLGTLALTLAPVGDAREPTLFHAQRALRPACHGAPAARRATWSTALRARAA